LFAFIFVSYKQNRKVEPLIIILLAVIIAFNLISSLVSYFNGTELYISPIIGSVVTLLLFSCGMFVPNSNRFWDGFERGAAILSIYIVCMFFKLSAYKYGISIFVIPEYRMWGQNVIYDWPNFICMIPIFGYFINYLRSEKVSFSCVLCMMASIMTTSRVAIVAIVFFMIIWGINNKKKIIILLTAFFFFLFEHILVLFSDKSISSRLTKSNDREHLFTGLIAAWEENPILGWGAVKVSTVFPDTYYDSFHNSYLEVLVKGGAISLALYLLLFAAYTFCLMGSTKFKNKTQRINSFIFLCFIFSACLVQNYLKHPHVIILFSIFCLAGAHGRKKLKQVTRND
jgi:O-antigen ligase